MSVLLFVLFLPALSSAKPLENKEYDLDKTGDGIWGTMEMQGFVKARHHGFDKEKIPENFGKDRGHYFPYILSGTLNTGLKDEIWGTKEMQDFVKERYPGINIEKYSTDKLGLLQGILTRSEERTLMNSQDEIWGTKEMQDSAFEGHPLIDIDKIPGDQLGLQHRILTSEERTRMNSQDGKSSLEMQGFMNAPYPGFDIEKIPEKFRQDSGHYFPYLISGTVNTGLKDEIWGTKEMQDIMKEYPGIDINEMGLLQGILTSEERTRMNSQISSFDKTHGMLTLSSSEIR